MIDNKKLVQAVKAFKSGNEDAFETIYEAIKNICWMALFNLNMTKTIDRYSSIEDFYQDIAVKVIDNLPSLKDENNFRSWVNNIARNHLLDMLKKHVSVVYDDDGNPVYIDRLVSLEAYSNDSDNDNCQDSFLYENGCYQSGDMDRMYDLWEAEEALAVLPKEQEEVYILCDVEGYSEKDAARILGININTLKSRRSAARKKLEKIVRE